MSGQSRSNFPRWYQHYPEEKADQPGVAQTRLFGVRGRLTVTERETLLAGVLFLLVLALYAMTRLVALDRYPIYFFADEATGVLYAENLLKQGLRSATEGLFPIYFEADNNRWTPLFSIYPQMAALALFGKSLFVTRAVSACISLLAAGAVGLTLKQVFKARFWWVGSLVLALIPAWFLHSRTAFETSMMVSFYACFLYAYLRYRTSGSGNGSSSHSLVWLYAALIFGGMAFYTYSNGQAVMGVTGLLFLLADLPYHIKQRRLLLKALPLAALVAWPFLAFQVRHASGMGDHLHAINSYLFQDLSNQEKVLRFLGNYLYGLSPQYWFLPNGTDLARHRMDSYGHIWLAMLPFFVLGLVLFLRHLRQPQYRLVLLTLLAVPAGASLAEIGITRTLAFVIPASLLIAWGIEALLGWLNRRISFAVLSLHVFIGLSLGGVLLLNSALTRGPTWSTDYGLYGMQWGASQLYEDVIPRLLEADPENLVLVTPAWANAADRFILFFLDEQQRQRVFTDGIPTYIFARSPLDDHRIFIATPDEYSQAQESGKFKQITVREVVRAPDSSPAFYVLQLAYVDDVERIFQAEREERSHPVDETLVLEGQTIQIRHSLLDMGELKYLFDRDDFTLIRGLEANPFLLELTFEQPVTMQTVSLDCGTMDMQVSITLNESVQTSAAYRGLVVGATKVEVALAEQSVPVTKLRIEILSLSAAPGSANVHIRELQWR